ncbi:stage II sporulation protein R [Moorella thermoacetica]|uniref:stage II sporulation protein R n=1 Tax=Neomoorella thermoacetica TaxID=1525 RepID=UPI0006A2A38C|nr:stage II sporulation protein R [Moorella thermoacetica]AKX93604.1 stage II sporulation protein R [Moorella thermoacetica]
MSRWKKSLLAMLLAGIVIMAGGSNWQEARVVPAYNSHNLIRLHVIANSDTPGDQELKRHVRDAVLASVGQRLAGAGDITTARKLVSTNLATITAAAEAQIKREGRSYTVRTEFGDFPFPIRAYGDLTLPAGNYEAVRLVIGEGRGQNWWCVLFPPLCLVDVASKGNPGPVAAGPPAMVAGMASEAGPAPGAFQVRWKIIEVFKTSRQYLASLWP